jgi:hypothetical protein
MADLAVLGDRHALPGPVGEQQLVGPVHVHAGQQDKRCVGQVRQHGVGVCARHRVGVDDRVRSQCPDLPRDLGEAPAVGVEVGERVGARGVGGFVDATVDDDHLVAPAERFADDAVADEPRSAKD